MTRVTVLGGGMVGAVMAGDLAREPGFEVTLVDRSSTTLARAGERVPNLRTLEADLSDPARVRALAREADVVCGALASHLGFAALRAVCEAGARYADISFMPEDALDLDPVAREHGAVCVVDCGVAPGMSNLLAGWGAARLERLEELEILVGGLPVVRTRPWEYKAGFAPADVIEEYTRPARFVRDGQVVTRPALSDPEPVEFPGLGTLEAFNTDGLRSLARTLDAPNMIEKTLRYPGHIELMRVLREAGFFGQDSISVAGQQVRPLDLTSALLFRDWTYAEGEEDLTVMRVVTRGLQEGRRVELRWDLFDRYDREERATSMSRTTAVPCALVARLLADGTFAEPGVHAPEVLGSRAGLAEQVLAQHVERGIHYEESWRVLDGEA